jgi:hypothetical protein
MRTKIVFKVSFSGQYIFKSVTYVRDVYMFYSENSNIRAHLQDEEFNRTYLELY